MMAFKNIVITAHTAVIVSTLASVFIVVRLMFQIHRGANKRSIERYNQKLKKNSREIQSVLIKESFAVAKESADKFIWVFVFTNWLWYYQWLIWAGWALVDSYEQQYVSVAIDIIFMLITYKYRGDKNNRKRLRDKVKEKVEQMGTRLVVVPVRS